jgi:hypothetical protein
MKPVLALTGLTIAFCAFASAEHATGGRVVVPARDGSHPRVVKCSTMNGSITVKTHAGTDVIVEDGSSRGPAGAPDGMKGIGMPPGAPEVTEEDGAIAVHDGLFGNGHLVITVPSETSLRLHTLSGAIDVDGVHGEVDVRTLNGRITLTGISGTVTADSQNGAIKVAMDRVDPGKPMAFSAFNGEVDLTFPPDLKANLTVKSYRGAVNNEFEVTADGHAAAEKDASPGPKHRAPGGNTIRGTVNGGGVNLTIRTFNGAVYIRKKK